MQHVLTEGVKQTQEEHTQLHIYHLDIYTFKNVSVFSTHLLTAYYHITHPSTLTV